MTGVTDMSGPAGAPDWLLDAAATATLALFGLGFAAGIDTPGAATALALGFAAHVLVSLYHGRFGWVRTAAWAMVFGGWAAIMLLGFLAMAQPLPQGAIWFALAGLFAQAGAITDVVALHGPRSRTSRITRILAVVALAGLTLAIVGDAMHLMESLQGNARPRGPAVRFALPIPFLPLLAMLRAVPSDRLGVALLTGLALLPATWPWRQAWRFHAAPTRLAFTLLWLGAAGGWIALGLLGGATPMPIVIAASRAILLYELGFFLVAPTLLARFIPPVGDRRPGVPA